MPVLQMKFPEVYAPVSVKQESQYFLTKKS